MEAITDRHGAPARDIVVGYYGRPGTPSFKSMVRSREWKYIYMANGAREQLFHMVDDPQELENRVPYLPKVVSEMRALAVAACQRPGATDALDGDSLRGFPFAPLEKIRICQFDRSRGITSFPENPSEVVRPNLNRR